MGCLYIGKRMISSFIQDWVGARSYTRSLAVSSVFFIRKKSDCTLAHQFQAFI